MIKVKVRLYATLRRYLPEMAIGQSADVRLPEGATVGALLDQLGIPRDEMRICYVGGLYSDLERQLRDGDDVALFPPVGGGEGPERLEGM